MTEQDIDEAIAVAWLKFKREEEYVAKSEDVEREHFQLLRSGFLRGCEWSNERFKKVMKSRGWKA